jgi:hypothetical protein
MLNFKLEYNNLKRIFLAQNRVRGENFVYTAVKLLVA